MQERAEGGMWSINETPGKLHSVISAIDELWFTIIESVCHGKLTKAWHLGRV